MAIKAIIFDCFGVLVDAGHVLMRRDYPELKTEIDDLQLKSDSDKISRQQFNEKIAELTGLLPRQVDDRYWGTNKFNQPMLDWVRDLKQLGKYKIGMLSNINRDWMDVCLPFFDRENLFDSEILSGDVGLVKPDPAIFKLMADKLNAMPSECIMIDDVLKNIEGAKQVGMPGIVYVSINQSKAELDRLLGMTNA
jgi:HAD superfamily hydrolase (TIGR01509 family)